ncbi:hypothetical protein AGMMS49546_13020 [Spirochaetia bacterium]|nr:hypothetical protein AGMMS49546_13020 [Spirochaetia bacterium]
MAVWPITVTAITDRKVSIMGGKIYPIGFFRSNVIPPNKQAGKIRPMSIIKVGSVVDISIISKGAFVKRGGRMLISQTNTVLPATIVKIAVPVYFFSLFAGWIVALRSIMTATNAKNVAENLKRYSRNIRL